jgi:hypothetical protein
VEEDADGQGQAAFWRAPWLSHFAVGWLAFVYLALGASPAHYWLDAGEITAAGAELGVMHPPGTPGLVPLLHLASLLPIGSIGFRMGLLSGAFAAAAVALLTVLMRRRACHWAVSAGAVLWIVAGLTFVRNARVVEIYALSAFLVVAFLCCFDSRAPQHRRTPLRLLGVAVAVWGAWCFGDLRLALVPTVVVLWVVALRRARPWAMWAPLTVVASSLIVLTIPLASAHGPVADWGNPQSLGAAWAHLQAEPIRAAFADEMLPNSSAAWIHNLDLAFSSLVQDLGPLGPVLTMAGLLLWARRPGDRQLLALIGVLIVAESFYVVGINPMGIGDRQTAIILGPLAALVVALNLQVWTREWKRARFAIIPIAWTAMILPAAAMSAGDGGTTRSWMPHAWSRDALAQLPPGALLLTQSDDLAAGLLAARTVEGARPDVVTVPAQHLHKAGPDHPGPREAQVWDVGKKGGSEAGRIVDVLTHPPKPPGAVAFELPGVGVFDQIPFKPKAGRPPLGLSTQVKDSTRAQSVAATFDRWEPQIESTQDGRRVARAIDLSLRGWIGKGTDDPNLLALAESSYLRVLENIDGDDVSTMLSLGAVHDATGRTDSAVQLTQRALELDPGRNAALLTMALYLSRDPNTQAQALEYAERAVALRPHRVENWRRLAQVSAAAGDTDRAQQAHDKANDLARRETSLR